MAARLLRSAQREWRMALGRVVIIGGGAMGSAIAYWLTADPAFAGEVVVLERDPSYREASSALSASSIRQQFSTPVNIAIGLFGIGFLRRVGDMLAVADERPEIGLVEPGYLFLATAPGMAVLRANHALQVTHGADVELLTPTELSRCYPWLTIGDLAGAAHGRTGEGWFDGYGLLRAFRAKAVAQGARYVAGEAVGLSVAGDSVTRVSLADGTRLAGDAVVNAAGPWAGKVAAMAGVDLPVRAKARSVFVLASPADLPDCPLVIDPSGFWVRPEGRHFVTGAPPRAGEDHDELPLEPDHALFEEVIWPALAARIPAFEQLRVVNAWAGYYEMNTFDQNGIVGPHPAIANLYFANGFSGHGIQQSPAVGRGIAELIVHGRYRSLDLSPLGFERLAAGRALIERNVI
jgi:FAD-dependent oxidoreductase domain-containing protein 1